MSFPATYCGFCTLYGDNYFSYLFSSAGGGRRLAGDGVLKRGTSAHLAGDTRLEYDRYQLRNLLSLTKL